MEGREGVAQLTEAEREVLRLYHVRMSAKEIGRELGITHFAVNERLRSARRVLGAASSGEAARQLAAAEEGATYNRIVYDPQPVAAGEDHVMFSEPVEDGEQPSRAVRHQAVGEERVPYQATAMPRLRLPLPRFRGERNDLTIRERLIWIVAIAFGLVAMVGALITISSGIVRMVGQILRAFA